MSPWRVLVLSVAMLLLAGCVHKPVLELHGASVQSASPAGIGIVLLMKVNNENAFDVKVRNVRADVVIAKRFRLPPVQYNPDRWLPAGKSTVVPVPVTVPWPLVGPLLSTSVGSNQVSYRVRGFADVTAVRMLGIQRNDHPIDEEGSVSRAQLFAAAGRGMMMPPPAPMR